MQTVRQLLDSKPNRQLIFVSPDATVFQALQVMAEQNVGAVLVMHACDVHGIFSERDYARRVVLQGRTSAGTHVREIMTSRVVYVTPEQTVDECMALMTEKRIRHLPVMEGCEVLGVVSIGDLVHATLEAQQLTIDQLVHYIQGEPASPPRM
ncbi:CBS domain-containing protein [Pseudogulbenkiania ferrooxidans]|jgi:CBS domain-containing protein|uniref:Putative signal transduction protein with CBS domains n=1 Tax=Pseudogulbenkiania ferrooxidans 2002 TaxID=279714 RepID=B9Z8B7_9NEIS|nr:CBS domain-containing protein [Pseudogulbenkiania ferrooxidans]EEG07020.1 putative signal transduction protein with CBS domains [Pseudogulbenkiania ferrooxidans 2002]